MTSFSSLITPSFSSKILSQLRQQFLSSAKDFFSPTSKPYLKYRGVDVQYIPSRLDLPEYDLVVGTYRGCTYVSHQPQVTEAPRSPKKGLKFRGVAY